MTSFSAGEKERFELLHQPFTNGLIIIAKIDGLDTPCLQKCANGLKKDIDTIFEFKNYAYLINELKLNDLGEKILLNRK